MLTYSSRHGRLSDAEREQHKDTVKKNVRKIDQVLGARYTEVVEWCMDFEGRDFRHPIADREDYELETLEKVLNRLTVIEKRFKNIRAPGPPIQEANESEDDYEDEEGG